MITPNKVVTVRESCLALSTLIMRGYPNPISVAHLYEDLSEKFESVDQFLLTLDFLFVMNKVQIDLEEGMLRYVD